MNLNFDSAYYKLKALNILRVDGINLGSNIKKEDAFLTLIKGISLGNLYNLCELLASKLEVSIEEAYKVTQETKEPNEKVLILESAYELINENKNLGTSLSEDGKFNLSDWISHCLMEAKLCYELSGMIGLNNDFAFNYGLLHDYGRKFSHRFDHTIIGFEELVDLDYEDLAKGCLTHSFINAGRYCNNEIINEGFELDENGKEKIQGELDDMAQILPYSAYTDYDNILCIADLMATSFGIVSPKDRIDDIASRRGEVDKSLNRCYFLASLTNLIIDFIKKMNINIDASHIDLNEKDLNKVKEGFYNVSSSFFEIYNSNKIDNNSFISSLEEVQSELK